MPSLSTFECFGLVLHGYTPEQAIARIDQNIAEHKQTMVVTTNPEILLEARKNPAYWNILRQADLRLVDGSGVMFAGWFMGALPKRVTGVHFSERLIQEAVQRGWKVALFGGVEGTADKAAWELRSAYPQLSILTESGGIVSASGENDEKGDESLFRLTQYSPDLLLVALGHPKQEFWISKHLTELPTVKVAVGVGGTFDFWAGEKVRAPKIFRVLAMEWLWRLIQEPGRWKRIFRAVVIFPITVVLSRFGG